ncbi:MAG: hypothetical protein K2J20_04715, partial [Bacilli bacterium]|nr:hypothetical protein [Bacilli bacterium]
MKISEIQPIEGSGYVVMPTKEQLASLVEAPILNACRIFWDKNIITGMSSANKKDVGGYAYLELPVRYLSEENLAILQTLPNVESYLNYGIAETVQITYPVIEGTTVEEVALYFETIANGLASQDILYGVFPLSNARDFYKGYAGIDAPANESDEEIAQSIG